MEPDDERKSENGVTYVAPSSCDAVTGPHRACFDVVAVGASAGGLGALRRLLGPLPASFPVPLLIVQHLAPTHVSMLAHILGRYTELEVKEAESGDPLVPGRVYIAPPGHHLLIGPDRRVELSKTALVHFSRPSVDTLFESVAARYGRRGIAVILTGAGKDGAEGLRAVKEAGGVTIVQDPGTAEYSSMPHFAVATQSADHVLPMERIPSFLIELIMQGGTP